MALNIHATRFSIYSLMFVLASGSLSAQEASAGSCSGPNLFKAILKGEPVCLTTVLPGYDVTGTYQTEGGKIFRTILNADGTATWENDPSGTTRSKWGIQVNMDGTAMRRTSEFAEVHRIFFAESWNNPAVETSSVFEFGISYKSNLMVIAGERFKRSAQR